MKKYWMFCCKVCRKWHLHREVIDSPTMKSFPVTSQIPCSTRPDKTADYSHEALIVLDEQDAKIAINQDCSGWSPQKNPAKQE